LVSLECWRNHTCRNTEITFLDYFSETVKFSNFIIIFMYHMHSISTEKGKKLLRDQSVFPEEEGPAWQSFCVQQWKARNKKMLHCPE